MIYTNPIEEMLLKEYLVKYRLTQEEFGQKADLSRACVQKVCSGSKPSIKTIKKIESVTNNEVMYDEKGNPIPS